MALNAYLAQVRSLLDDPGAVEYTDGNLTIYINDARVQIAGASESIRAQVDFPLASGSREFAFTLATGLPTGVAGILSVRMARVSNFAGGWKRLEMRSWEYFYSFRLCVAVSVQGFPTMAAQLNPGIGGTLWVDPVPDIDYTASLDAVGYPAALVTDATPELLPQPWTEAVQYYAAYLAYLNAQRRSDADAMFERYKLFEQRATQMTRPSRLPNNYPGGMGATIASQGTALTGPAGGRR